MPAAVKNACAGPFGAAYDYWIERERLARVVGPLIWGIDARPMFASMRAEIGGLGDGAVIIDVPCGGGIAFRALRRDRRVRHHAVDLDEAMLGRARRRASVAGVEDQIEFLVADMRDLPFDDGFAQLGLSYSGLHMIPDPDKAIAELVRCVRLGGRIAGTTFLAGGTRRQRVLFALGGRTGHAVPEGSEADLERWLTDAGVTDIEISTTAGFALFAGRRA